MSAILAANKGGTALPICFAISVLVPLKIKKSGKLCNRAASRCVIGRCCLGWRYLPFSDLKNSVRIVNAGLSHHNLPNKSVPPEVFFSQHCGVSPGAFLYKSNLFIPSFGIALYRLMLFGVGFLPKCKFSGDLALLISVPVGSGKSAMASRTVLHFSGLGK